MRRWRLKVGQSFAAQRDVPPEVRRRQSRTLDNRTGNARRPIWWRERQMQRFKSPGRAQRFLSTHGIVYGHFHPRRHLMPARAKAFRIWRRETCVQSTR